MKEVYIFPGQGSQRLGMAKELLDQSEVARGVFSQAETVLSKLGWERSLQSLCLEGPVDILNKTEIAQPAILTVSIAGFKNTLIKGSKLCGLVTGHSLGEYSALTAAGVFTFEDAIGLVAERGKLMEKASGQRPGKMVAVIGLGVETVETLCKRLSREYGNAHVTIANINSPDQIVISGDQEAIENAEGFAKELGARMTKVLPISIAAHSDLMKSAQQGMAIALESTDIKEPEINFISPTTGKYEDDPRAIRELLITQLTGRVLWLDTVKRMIEDGYDLFLEVGPGEVLTRLFKRIDEDVKASSLNL